MTVSLPQLRVGDPLRHDALSVFPLFSPSIGEVDYRLSDSAMADESLLIEEISEGGSVPELLVENKGDLRVLFLEGEELVGAKQNRILNTSVLVAPHTKIKIPVSCVERGRWGYKSRYFRSSGSHTPSKLRRALKASVSRAVTERRGHASDQSEVWREVACLHFAHNVRSETAAMSDAFDRYDNQIAEFRKNLAYVDGATGIVFAIGQKIVAFDVFDKPSTCEKVWDRMLSGVILDALEAGDVDQHASVADVERVIYAVGDLPWSQSEAVGEGEEFRAQSDRGDHASALAVDDTLVHGSLVAAV